MTDEEFTHTQISEWIDTAGVYGLGKSYSDAGNDHGVGLIPYFYRGTAKHLAGPRGVIVVDRLAREPAAIVRLSEEFELVVLLERNDNGWIAVGYTFGNDLSDLGLVQENGTLIQLSKRINASVAKTWWKTDVLPRHIPIQVSLVDKNGVRAKYDAQLGTDYLRFSIAELVQFIPFWAGTEQYNHLLVYTGAPRGFAWHDETIHFGETLKLEVQGLGETLSNQVVSKA